MLINKEISKCILTVGLPYKQFKGGISKVINTYSKYFECFKFLSTYKRSRFNILLIPFFILSCIRLFYILTVDQDIKIVHVHGAAKGSLLRKGIIIFISKVIFSKIIIYHSHGSELKDFYENSHDFIKKFIKNIFNHCDLIICLSKEWKSFFQNNFSVKRIEILENIVEDPQVDIEEKSFNFPIRLLFLGLIGSRKGIFDLLEVISCNRKIFKGRLCLAIGGRGENTKLEDYIRINGLSDIVYFYGWITGDEKKKLLKESHLYILPSYNEGLPISILEAMSYGLPVVSTYVGGIPQVVHHEVNGLLIHPGKKDEIFESLYRFIKEPHLLKVYAEQAKIIVTPYYAASVVPKLELIYKSLL